MVVSVEYRIDGIDETLLELLSFLHPAVDPDTGHHVCHHHSLGLATLNAGGRRIPALLLGGCAMLVVGEDAVSALLGDASGEERLESMEPPKALIGGVEADAYWVMQALRAAAEMNLRAVLRVVEVEGGRWVLVELESRGRPSEGLRAALLIPPPCGEEGIRRRSQSFYQ